MQPITANVNASFTWKIDWDDGSEDSTTTEHTYTISGTFSISGNLIFRGQN